ncbi:MAG: PRC-barrel domain-containing protein [Planctomycetota bacterium]
MQLTLLASSSLLLATVPAAPQESVEDRDATPAPVRSLALSDLRGAAILGDDGQRLGEVSTAVVDLDTGRVDGLVLATRSAADSAREQRLLDFADAQWQRVDDALVLTSAPDGLAALPRIEGDLDAAMARRYGGQPAQDGTPPLVFDFDGVRGEGIQALDSPIAWGELVDLRVDSDGALTHAIASVTHAGRPVAQRHPIPIEFLAAGFASLEPGSDAEPRLRLSVERARADLEAAPALEEEAGRTLDSKAFRESVDRFWTSLEGGA